MYDFHNVALSQIESLFLNIAILSIIVISLIRSERSLRDQSQWALLFLLAVFGVSGRILLDPIPNALAAIIALASNAMLLGHGPWTLFQAIGWGGVALVGAILANRIVVEGNVRIGLLAVIAAISGLAFNWFVSLSILLDVGPPMLIPYLLNGLAFDLYHVAGNVMFVAWMASPLGEMMHRHRSSPSFEAVRDRAPN